MYILTSYLLIPLFYVISIPSPLPNSIIKVPLRMVTSTPSLQIQYVNQHIIFFTPINQALPFTWTNTNDYDPTLSRSHDNVVKSNINNTIENKKYFGDYLYDDLILYDLKTTISLNFYLVPSFYTYRQRRSSWGFAFKFEDEDFSIIHKLHSEKIIQHWQYSIYPVRTMYQKIYSNKFEITIYLGGLPEETIQNKYRSNCNIDNSRIEWNCNLSKIIFDSDNKTFPNKYYTYFNSIHESIIVPKDFFDFLGENTIIKRYWNMTNSDYDDKEVRCWMIEFLNVAYYRCSKQLVDQFGVITFVIDGVHYRVDLKEIFDCAVYSCNMKLQYNSDMPDVFVLGMGFLNFYITWYDYESERVSFYSDHEWVVEAETTVDEHRSLNEVCIRMIVGWNVTLGIMSFFWICIINKHRKRDLYV